MYGEMSQLRARAADLRGNAVEMRARAKSLIAQSESMTWSSHAGDILRSRIHEVALDLGRQAQSLDDVASALEAHARAVDSVKADIAAAEKWVTVAWGRALSTATHTVEVVRDVVHNAVSGLMHVVGAAASGDVDKVRVSVLTLAGHEISRTDVQTAKSVVGTVPSLPPSGAKDWLDLAQTFTARGWR